MLRKPHKLRLVILGSAFFALATGVCARLYVLQVARHDEFVARATRQQTKRIVLQPERGDILDRAGQPLATSAGTLSVYIDTRYFKGQDVNVDLDALAGQVAYYTGQKPSEVRARFERDGVITLQRQLDPVNAAQVARLFDDQGIDRRAHWFHRESKRLYPRALAPHVIGFCGTDSDGDNHGLAGLEFRYNDLLNGTRIEATASRTGISQALDAVDQKDILASRGNTLVLTIDSAIQEAAEQALLDTAALFEADAAGAIVQDVNTGEILAMASWPTYNNSNYKSATDPERRNRTLTDPIETGSVAKLFTGALLLEAGKVGVDTPIDCEGGHAYFGRRRIADSPGHYLDVAPFHVVMRFSSNIGIIKASLALEDEEYYNGLRALGLGQQTGIDLPGEGSGILRGTDRWSGLTRTSLPMGYEMALTPIQIVNGISSLVNGGNLLKPHVVREIRDPRGNTLFSARPEVIGHPIRPDTSQLVRYLMEDVVANGTGKKAQVPGFRVGGKTGTTRKSHVLTHREYIASFAGVLPIDDPRVAIYCWVDNPKGGAYYASDVAAPLFQKIARAVVLHLGLVPTATDIADVSEPPFLASASGTEIPPQYTVAPGRMPDLVGLSMIEAREALAGRASRVRFLGSGRVREQTPEPGALYDSTTEIVLAFAQDVAVPRPASPDRNLTAAPRSARP